MSVLVVLVLSLGLQQRLLYASHIPINVDEVTLLREIEQMHGLPVHFIGFGWGENVLLAYFAKPLMLTGISPLRAIRLIACFANLILVLLTAFLARHWFGGVVGFIALCFGSFWPWYVISGSIGFNINVAMPFFVAAGILFAWSMRNRKSRYAILAGLFFGIASYGYIMCLMWAAFFFCITGWLCWQRKNMREWLWMISVFTIVILPLVLFYAKNMFGLRIPDEIWLFQFPTLTSSRIEDVGIIGSWFQRIMVFVSSYLSHFNFFYLAVNPFQRAQWSFLSFMWDPFFIYIALFRLLWIKKMPKALFWWLCVYPIGSSLTEVLGIFSLTRDSIGAPALLILSSFGCAYVAASITAMVKKRAFGLEKAKSKMNARVL